MSNFEKEVNSVHPIFPSSIVPFLVIAAAARLVAATPPMVGEKAPDFALSTVDHPIVRSGCQGSRCAGRLTRVPWLSMPLLQPPGSGFHQQVAGFYRRRSACDIGLSGSPR